MIRSLVAAPLLLVVPIIAQDWPHWRGPSFNGAAPGKDLPVAFSAEKNVRWKADMPGSGASTPIVLGDKIFLTSVDVDRDRLLALCVERDSGKILWQRDAGSGYRPGGRGSRVQGGRRATYASPSAATDGERVLFFFGNGDLVCFDLAGEELWRRNVQEEFGRFAFNWTFSASPTFCEGLFHLPVLQRDVPIQRRRRRGRGSEEAAQDEPAVISVTNDSTVVFGGKRVGVEGVEAIVKRVTAADSAATIHVEMASLATADLLAKVVDAAKRAGSKDVQVRAAKPIESYLLGMDPATGRTVYCHVRPSPAQVESLESYTTLIPHQVNGKTQLLLAGGDVLTGHDPKTGKEHWRWGTWNEGHRERFWRLVPSVVVGDGLALVCAPKRDPVYAVEIGAEGALPQSAVRWQSSGRPNPVSSDVPTPAFHDGHFYVLSDVQRALSKVTVGTGEVVWSIRMPGEHLWRASPTVADGKIYCMNHNGLVAVVDAADGKILHTAAMAGEDDDLIRASVVVAHQSLFVRTNDALFCIGK